MRKLGSNAKAMLEIFDEGPGGLAAPASVLAEILEEREISVSKANLLLTLNRLSRSGELSKIARPKGGAVYTRPRNLERVPGYRSQLEGLPTLNIRRRSSTSDRRYELRVKRRLKALGKET